MTKSKRIIASIIAAAIAATAVPVWANPILSHKYTADPQPIVWNNRLYVYASNDDLSVVESDGYVIQAYTLVSTDDMANWTDHGEVFRVPRDWNRGNASNARAYAPGAAVRNNTVYVYPCGAGGPVGVVSAPRPEGPFNDVHRGTAIVDRNNRIITSASGTTATTCTNCNVPWMFDPMTFVDDDGQGYLYYGGGGENDNPGAGQNMRVLRLNDDMVSIRDANATTVAAPRSFEAAYMHRRGNTYYFSYVNNWAGGDGHPSAAIMYMTGSSPMGPFTLRGPVLRNPAIGNQNINRHNNNHHAPVEYNGKWYMLYHDRRVADANGAPSVNQRNISVDSLVYNADGTMREVVVTANGVAQIKNLNPYETVRAATINRQLGIRVTNNGERWAGNDSTILSSISNNDWIRLKGVDFKSGASKVTVRAASNSAGGSIEFRTGSETGTLIGTCNITSTGGWTAWRNFECDINKTASAGVKDFLYLVFKGTASELFRLASYQFEEEAVACDGPAPTPTPNNLVSDGIFSGPGLGSSWSLANMDDGAAASASVRCNEVTIDITSTGAEIYQPQLIQQGIRLERRKSYKLTFDASSVGGNRTIVAQLERLGGDGVEWGHMYGQKTFNLTAAGGTHELEFGMDDPTDGNAQLAFNFGGSARSVTIRNVRLVETGDITVPCNAIPPTAGNLVENGTFAGDGLSPHWTFANTTGGAAAEASLGCNEVTVTISSTGTAIYQPQLIQQGITLEQGKGYKLTFKASAATNRSIVVQLERRGDADKGWDWGYTYGQKTFNLTTNETAHELEFDMTDSTDQNVQLAFNFGASTHDVTISDVVLLATGSVSISHGQTAPAVIRPLITINGRILNVSSSGNAEMKIRVIDVRGRVRADFKSSGGAKFSLARLPAGRYFVDIKGAGVKNTTSVMLK
ncbi:MAG: family 43 glycosylhydrolase [Chitinispirillales bacterium]|jgi:arabinoxylan arabinofuranohydrolase|nr:family 43 glycosylhydrolase [Chitinispirillales bacterium]